MAFEFTKRVAIAMVIFAISRAQAGPAQSCARIFGLEETRGSAEIQAMNEDATGARQEWLRKERKLQHARQALTRKYLGSEKYVDIFLQWIRRLELDGRVVQGPVGLVTMVGPTGIGKTGLVEDLGDLAGVRVEKDTPDKGAVRLDVAKLRDMTDQRNSDGRPRILVIDEIQHLKPFRDLERNKKVLIEDPDILEALGAGAQPLYREVDEVEQRRLSQEYFLQFLGGGRITRKPIFTPEEYRKKIRELTVDYKMNLDIIEGMKGELTSDKGNKAASEANASILEGAQRKFRKAAIDLYNLIDQARDDQPELFSSEGRKAVSGYSDVIPEKLGELSFNQVMSIVTKHPDNFADFIDERARQLPQHPTETCYKCFIVITGNPDVFIEEIVRGFYGREPTPDELRAAIEVFNEKHHDRLVDWYLQFFDDSQAMRSRLKVNDLEIMPPLSTKNYQDFVRRDMKDQETLFAEKIAEMGMPGTRLVYDASVEKVINAEVISALAGTRTVGPRIGQVVEPIRMAVSTILAELKQLSAESGKDDPIPNLITISYSEEDRTIRSRARMTVIEQGQTREIEDSRFAMDFDMPRFDGSSRVVLTQEQKERRANFLSASIIIGTLVHGSVPLDVHLGINRPSDFQGWVLNYENGDHATLQARLYTVLSGVVGNHLVKRGALVNSNGWDRESQLLASGIMENIIDDVRARKTDYANLNAVMRFNARFNLPMGMVRLFQKFDYKSKPEMLSSATRRITGILQNNKPLMKALRDHLVANGRISSAEIKEMIRRYDQNEVTRWQRFKNLVGKAFRPLGPSGLLTMNKIAVNEPGMPYQAADYLNEQVTFWEKIRRALGMSRPGWSPGLR